MKLFVYSHRIDCDGLCSAAILKRYADRNSLESNLEFINYEPVEEAEEVFDRISKLPSDSEVIIVDFGYTKSLETIEETALKKLKERGVKITWLDHHKWDSTFMDRMRSYADITVSGSSEHCGAELAYLKYMKEDPISEALAKLGRDADIDAWKTDPPSPKYALTPAMGNVITYYNYLGIKDTRKRTALLTSLANSLSSASLEQILNKDFEKPFWNDKLANEWREYQKLEKNRIDECVKGAEVFTQNGYRCAVSFSDPLISSTIAAYSLIKKYDCQLSIVFYENGRLAVRRKNGNDEIKCNKIAELFNGGGHEFAAGGTLKRNISTPEQIASTKKEIKDKLLASGLI